MFKRSLPRLAFLFAAVLAAAQAYAGGKCERLVATGNPEFAPYLWRDPKNPERLIGAAADLLKRLSEELGVSIELVYSGAGAQAEEEVRSGRIDLLLGTAISLSSLETMDFIHPPLFSSPSVIWARRGGEFAYGAWTDLQGHSGSKLANSHFSAEFDRYAKQNLKLRDQSGLAKAFQSLLSGRLDYVVYERYSGQALAETLAIQDDLVILGSAVFNENTYLALSHNSACNDPWLRGQLAKKMTEFTASGLPATLLQRNSQRWTEQQHRVSTQNQ